MSQKEIQESLELLEKDWDVDPLLHDFVLGKYTDVTDFTLIVKNVVFHIPYLPKELKPIFSDPFKALNEKELQRALNISKKSIRFIFENPLDEILLEWKPFLMSSLNDIKLFHLESKKEVEGFLERRYSPLFKKGLTKKR